MATTALELPWNGEPLKGPTIAFDTETEVVDLTKEIPTLVCLTAYDGHRNVLVLPGQIATFVLAHSNKFLTAWNLAFDWWVVYQELTGRRVDLKMGPHWQERVDQHLFGDAALLEQLYRLASGQDQNFGPLSLKKAAARYLRIEVDKDDEIRTGFTRDMALNYKRLDYRKSWEYAAKDAIVTWQLDRYLRANCENLRQKLPFESDQEKWGLLTEQIQVKSSIALAQITRNGITVDRPRIADLVTASRREAKLALADLDQRLDGKLFKRWKKKNDGGIQMTENGLPKIETKYVEKALVELAKRYDLDPPRTEKDKRPTISAAWYMTHMPDEPLVKAWNRYQTAAKVLTNTTQLEGLDRVHSKYWTLVRTGRTSASSPNIQNQDRDHRDLFIAGEGHVLGAFDYSAVELVTLAAVCENRMGRSVLGEVLRAGRDPHRYTASLLKGIPEDQVDKASRQAAKALNFGIPGGLGADRLRAYALTNYKAVLSKDEAYNFRKKLITQVYPELSEWLADGLARRLSIMLKAPLPRISAIIGTEENSYFDPIEHPLVRVWAGMPTKKDGSTWSRWYVNEAWIILEKVLDTAGVQLPLWLIEDSAMREGSYWMADYLIRVPSVTLTGRSRARTFYGDERNTQFQGLAADGAKIALWETMKQSYKNVAFVHDELVFELPERTAENDSKRIAGTMSDSLRSVLGKSNTLPVRVEYALGKTWSKP